MNELDKLYQEYIEILRGQNIQPEDIDYELMDEHSAFLKQLDLIENSSISVFDLYKKEHVFVSSNFSGMLGYNIAEIEKEGNKYFDSRVHPDDFLQNLKMGIVLLQKSLQIPVTDRRDYKFILDYRVRNAKNQYIRVIEQQQVLELDKKGNIWLALSTIDLSPDQDLSIGPKYKMYNFKTGDIINSPEFDETKEGVSLSFREQEVLKLVKDGLPSKEIAERLFISVHTVNTHRQRILEKLDVTNSIEAIQYASWLGLME